MFELFEVHPIYVLFVVSYPPIHIPETPPCSEFVQYSSHETVPLFPNFQKLVVGGAVGVISGVWAFLQIQDTSELAV